MIVADYVAAYSQGEISAEELSCVLNMAAKPKPKKHKKTERQVLDAECMELLKQIVRLKYPACVTCGSMVNPTASHYHKRGKSRLRYDLRNVARQCAACNNRHNYYHGEYEAWMLKNYGADVVAELAELSSLKSWKWTIPELREIRGNLQHVLDNNGILVER